ncbi:MAG: site-2 protease family protein [candidate division KSB1 bacterium]|nr:site-2 protease family protein [candidate division KSB1 bacterium]MDZ7364676.1 site-2 protease family protein [candidate division KSB1 bacterium]MDZ7402576.1 site-2 protease family protein [candidate division KSB1 bacterium]
MPENLVMGPMWYVVFLLSLTCHEAAHALAAKWGGDLTAFHAGQVTLNPMPHMRREPFGTIVVPILSFLLSGWMIGWASAPYDPSWQQRYPRRAAWMALAGPIANFVLVILAALAIWIGIGADFFHRPEAINFTNVVAPNAQGLPHALATFFSILFSLNLLLATFNLLPVPPLDGNTVAGLFLSEKAALKFAELSHNQAFSLIGLLAAWKIFDVVFRPVFLFALNLLYPGANYQ